MILFGYTVEERGSLLLYAYWALKLPELGSAPLGNFAGDLLPNFRALLERFLEPTEARIREQASLRLSSDEDLRPLPPGPVQVDVEGVTLQKGGTVILRDLSFRLLPGEHTAIVGASGAGKSTLVRAILGVHEPEFGKIRLNGQVRDGKSLGRHLVWIDSDVQLWNRSLLENVRYGASDSGVDFAEVLRASSLMEVLGRLESGLATKIGAGGSLLSGGEGQRVRIARGFGRTKDIKLAILDEPFRGLQRTLREKLLSEVRQQFRDTTLVCVTHDVGNTVGFDKVVVMENGSMIEYGDPRSLLSQESRYRELIEANERCHDEIWGAASSWNQVHLEGGRLRRE